MVCGRMRANWSPPKRAQRSISLTDLRKWVVSSWRILSPVPWPNLFHLLEVIYVDKYESERISKSICALAFVGKALLECAVSGDAGQRIREPGIILRV